MSIHLHKNPVCKTMYEFYEEYPPVDATPARFVGEQSDVSVSMSLIAQLSPVWKCSLLQTSFQKPNTVELGLTRVQFEAVKDIWLRLMVSHPHPADLRRKSAAFAIKLLIALDMLQIHPSVMDYVAEHAKRALTVEDVAEVATDPEIDAMTGDVLEIILPTLLEHPAGVRITNRLIQQEVDKHSAYSDPRGLVWINRQRSVTAAKIFYIEPNPDGKSLTVLPGVKPMPEQPHRARRFTLLEALSLDDTHAVCQFFQIGEPIEEYHFVICLDTATGDMVGRPQCIEGIAYPFDPMLMNGHHFVFPNGKFTQVYNRTMDFFHAEQTHTPQQTIELMDGETVHVLCRGVSDLLFVESGKSGSTLTVLRCTGRDDTYTPQYTIRLHCGAGPFNTLGGLVLSPTRVILHFGTVEHVPRRMMHLGTAEHVPRQMMKLQLFERDAPVCPPFDAGPACQIDMSGNHRQNGTDRLCHKFGRIYFFRDNHSLYAFDAKADDLSTPLLNLPINKQAALAAYGARILMLLGDPRYSNTRVMLFDPRTGTMDKKELALPSPYIHKTVALQGGNILFASHDGEFHIVKRVE